MTKLLENKLFIYLLAVFFLVLPLERIPTFEIGGYTIKSSYILALIIIFLTIFTRIWNKLERDSLNSILVLFWLVAAVGLVFSPSRRGMLLLALWAFVFLLFFALSYILKRNSIRNLAISLIIYSSLGVSLFGLFQFFGDSLGLSREITLLRPEYTKAIMGFPRIQSTGLEPLYFANFLLVPIFLIFSKYVESQGLFNRHFWLMFIVLLNIGLTVSRGAYIGLLTALIILLIYLLASRQLKKVAGILAVSLLAATCTYLIILKVNGETASNNLRSHSIVIFQDANQDGSSADRLTTYKIAYNFFKERPILGNGLGSFGIRYTPEDKKSKGIYATVNNEYIEILAENGIVGLALFVSFLLIIFILFLKRYRTGDMQTNNFIVPLFLGLLAIFIQYNFFSTLYIIYIWVFLAMLKASITKNMD